MFAALASLIAVVSGQTQAMPALVPQPLSVKPQEGRFVLSAETSIVAGKAEAGVARTLQRYLQPATGFPLEIKGRGDKGAIHLRLSKGQGDEGYRLTVRGDRVDIEASTDAGLFYGVQTLRQLLPTPIYRQARVDGVEWTAPAVAIEDSPRFKWRGGMLDVGRHFMPKEFVMKFIDLLAMHKMNVFHWHLTEDQGWRIEIKKYPLLTAVGAWRKDDMLKYSPEVYSGKPHGGFYTQDDVREIVAYAKERFITVVPEIEMPGHSQAAIAAYPSLGNYPDKQLDVATKWGVMENVYNVDDSTISFLQDVLTEVMDLFPGAFIHIGGDECPKVQWKASEKVQAKMKSLGLKDEHAMQSWFIGQMDKFLAAKGRRLIGWSEILEGGLAEKAALMVWLGDEGALEAVSSGHDVVMAQTNHTYFDYYQSKNTKAEPWAIGGYLPLKTVYSYDPILPAMTAEQAKHVLGVQFQTWTEYIGDPKHVEYMVFPRGCALAEVAWSAKANENYDRFAAGLPQHLERLRALDVNFRHLDPPGAAPTGTWKTGQTTETFAPMTWDITWKVDKAGKYTVQFQYTGGEHRLDIEWAEILENGVAIGRDAHKGTTGGRDKDNVYTIEIPAVKAGAKYVLRASVRSDAGTDSNGEIYVSRG